MPVDPAGVGALVLGGSAGHFRAILDDHRLHRVGTQRQGFDDGRQVLDDTARFDATGCCDDHFRTGIVQSCGEFLRGESAEHDRVHGAQPRAGEHRHDRLGDHRQVDHDPVALHHAEVGEHAGAPGDLVEQLAVAVALRLVHHGGVVDQRGGVTPAREHMAVEGVVAGVEPGIRKPAVERSLGIVERRSGVDVPVDRLRRVEPETLGVVGGTRHDALVRAEYLVLCYPLAHERTRAWAAQGAKDMAFLL
ncbi:hypothetical protein JOE66_000943 [Subtercola frigoramans]|uniref:Uncharacterized protein n=1 Tax=Subtercola frigoramans TaxID=120298 RepID=A0ABS2L2R3_9MICO|nr:hypothetical protein [Subtercola frigoramans]